MSRNIEVKARLADLGATRRRVEEFADSHPGVEEQEDVYYKVDAAGLERVKIRTSSRHGRQLIRYHRPEGDGVRPSEYTLTPLAAGEVPPEVRALGDPEVVVRKRRDLFWKANVRIHLDEVEGLGTFLELEAVVDAANDDASSRARVDALLADLGIGEADLVRASYSDLLR